MHIKSFGKILWFKKPSNLCQHALMVSFSNSEAKNLKKKQLNNKQEFCQNWFNILFLFILNLQKT